MIKSETAPSFSKEYPLLKQNIKHPEVIVLFSDCRTGVVLATPSHHETDAGYYSTYWVEEHFEPFTGRITLSNKD